MWKQTENVPRPTANGFTNLKGCVSCLGQPHLGNPWWNPTAAYPLPSCFSSHFLNAHFSLLPPKTNRGSGKQSHSSFPAPGGGSPPIVPDKDEQQRTSGLFTIQLYLTPGGLLNQSPLTEAEKPKKRRKIVLWALSANAFQGKAEKFTRMFSSQVTPQAFLMIPAKRIGSQETVNKKCMAWMWMHSGLYFKHQKFLGCPYLHLQLHQDQSKYIRC